ncbi:MAG TPA: DUF4386 domain-containing protein [Mobilitalea sp.]|nr:DUF4386 domain-containing protein [Mobilitalea sp.]
MKDLYETTIKPTTSKKTARIVGALFLIAMAASLFGGNMVNSILSSANILSAVSENKPELLIGTLIELINAIAVVGIAVLMFPFLKKYNQSMALGYLCFRSIEALFCSFIAIAPLSLMKLSQEYSNSGGPNVEYFKASGALLIAQRASCNDLLIPVFFCAGAVLFYWLLYKSRLIPRFISIWGFIAAISVFVMNLLSIFHVVDLDIILMVLALPMIVNEIFLGIWLIIKGFNPSTSPLLSTD